MDNYYCDALELLEFGISLLNCFHLFPGNVGKSAIATKILIQTVYVHN